VLNLHGGVLEWAIITEVGPEGDWLGLPVAAVAPAWTGGHTGIGVAVRGAPEPLLIHALREGHPLTRENLRRFCVAHAVTVSLAGRKGGARKEDFLRALVAHLFPAEEVDAVMACHRTPEEEDCPELQEAVQALATQGAAPEFPDLHEKMIDRLRRGLDKAARQPAANWTPDSLKDTVPKVSG
jgi:hypothetical protein